MVRVGRTLAVAAGALGLLAPGQARADLTGDFAGALDLDPGYVTGANGATDIAFAADGRAVITQKSGSITIRRTDGTKNVLMGTFPNIDTGSEKGLNGIVADPRAGNAFFLYADNGPSNTDKHQVYHAVLEDDDTLTVDLENPVVAAGLNDGDPGLEGPANHDGGGLDIYDGHLYIAVGDTGANATPPTNKYASCLNKGNGKILRVKLDGTIPDDNPLASETMVTGCSSTGSAWTMAAPDRRVYAWGFRNPFRFWVDPHTGRMWIGDVGETTREEISVSDPAASYTGQHFGYPFHEGTTDWSMDGGELRLDKTCDQAFEPSRPCVAPVTDYRNERNDGANCVIGGLIPEGCGWSSAFGGKLYYWFADFGASWVHAVEVKTDRSGVVSSTPISVGEFGGAGPAAIRQGPNGAVYLVNNKEGSVYEIQPKNQTGDDCMSMGGMGGASGSAGSTPTAGSGAMTAGRNGSGGSGGTGGGATAGMGQAGNAAKPADSDESGGCGCRASNGDNGALAAAMAALGLAGLALTRRRSSS
jgi:MYXO-CTERM domain-containing protein